MMKKLINDTILDRRLVRILNPVAREKLASKAVLDHRFDHNIAKMSVLSTRVIDFGKYSCSVNHTGLLKRKYNDYYVSFDIYKKDAPELLCIEGTVMAGDFQFEDSFCIKDIEGSISFNFDLINNALVPDDDMLVKLLKQTSGEDEDEEDEDDSSSENEDEDGKVKRLKKNDPALQTDGHDAANLQDLKDLILNKDDLIQHLLFSLDFIPVLHDFEN